MASGLQVSRILAGATTNATLVKASPGVVNVLFLHNAAAYAVFFKLYDSATIPTAGAGTPKMTIGVAAGVSITTNFGTEDPTGGVFFASGIGYTITKLVADNDVTVLVANDADGNLMFK